MAKFALKDANIAKLALCKIGANRNRVFLVKTGDDDDDQRHAAFAPLIKAGKKDWRVAYVPVAVPDAEEDQGIFGTGDGDVDVWDSEDEIAKAAHSFMHNGQEIVAQHFDTDQADGVKLVENAIALNDFKVPGTKTTIAKGTWYVGLEFNDPKLREAVDNKEIDAVSVEGFATRVAKAQMVQAEPYSEVAQHPETVNLDAIPSGQYHDELKVCMAWIEGRLWIQIGGPAPVMPDVVAKVNEATYIAKDAILVPNKPGVKNWVEEHGGLPKFIADIAGDLITERHKTTGNAIQLAVGIVRNWCHGHGGNVTAATRAKACEASAAWEALKAKAHASGIAKESWDTGDVECEDCQKREPLMKRIAKALGIETDDPKLTDEDFFVAEDCTEFGVADEDDFPTDREQLAKAKLSYASRKQLPKSAFVFPDKAPGSGAYPIHDRSHAANALSRAKGKPEEKTVRSAVCKRHPSLPACKRVAKEDSLQDDPGTVGDVEIGERVEALEDRIGGLEKKLIGTEDEPGAVAKMAQAVDKLAEKLDGDGKPAEKDEPESRDEIIAKAQGDLEAAIEKHVLPIAKRLDELEAGDSEQVETNGNGDSERIAKGESGFAGIIFD